MTVVVTGAAGHVGGNLVRALLAEGKRVRALVHRDRRALEGLDVELVQGDVVDPGSLRRAFADADTVYHTAGIVSIQADDWRLIEAVNVVGTRNVVEACLAASVGRLVHFSSIHALRQEPLDQKLDESRLLVSETHPDLYDRSKAAGEREVQKGIVQGLDAVILNPTAILGPYDYGPSHMGQTLLALSRGKLPALVPGGFDWVDVRDVAEAALRATERAPRGAKYLLSGHWARLRDLATIVGHVTGVRGPWFTCPMFLAKLGVPLTSALARLRGKRPLYTRFALDTVYYSHRHISHERATQAFDYLPRPLEETVCDTLQWFAEAGCLDRPLERLSPS